MFFEFSEYGESAQVNINTENAEISSIDIHNTSAMWIKIRDTIMIVWNNEERYFLIRSRMDEAELLKIAHSIRLIVK